jgi:hypothetical protein
MSHGNRPIYEHSSLLSRRYIFPPASPELIRIGEFSFHVYADDDGFG